MVRFLFLDEMCNTDKCTDLKYTIWWILTKVYTSVTIPGIKRETISILPKALLCPFQSMPTLQRQPQLCVFHSRVAWSVLDLHISRNIHSVLCLCLASSIEHGWQVLIWGPVFQSSFIHSHIHAGIHSQPPKLLTSQKVCSLIHSKTVCLWPRSPLLSIPGFVPLTRKLIKIG